MLRHKDVRYIHIDTETRIIAIFDKDYARLPWVLAQNVERHKYSRSSVCGRIVSTLLQLIDDARSGY